MGEAMIKVYIAGPYTKGDVAQNVRNAVRLADYITQRGGFVVFIPHLTHFWHMLFPRPYEFWLAQDMEWLKVCDVVIRIEGDSSGADKEIAEAERLGIPWLSWGGFTLDELSRLDKWLAGCEWKEVKSE